MLIEQEFESEKIGTIRMISFFFGGFKILVFNPLKTNRSRGEQNPIDPNTRPEISPKNRNPTNPETRKPINISGSGWVPISHPDPTRRPELYIKNNFLYFILFI